MIEIKTNEKQTKGERVMFMYCKKCGLILNVKSTHSVCPACEITLESVPSEYLTSTGFMFSSQSARKEFENAIKASDDFDESAYEQRDSIIAQKEEAHKKDVAEKVEQYKSTRPQKTCPICQSTSISKISNVGKIVKVGAFGILGAGDIGKTWKCNSCGCKF